MRSRRRFVARIVIFLISSWLTVPGFVQATTLQKLSFDRLIGEADLIIKGRVEELKTRQVSDRRSMTTIVTVSIERQFKGPKVSSVTIEQPGGSVGDIAQGVPGLPEFSSGEEVIVFLKRQRGGAFNILGGKQGKFTAKTQPGGREEVVEDFAHRTETLESFLDRLTSMVKGGG
ncbi:MAG TPA: hypothetical protein VGW77_06180 [Candidatus Binatia bacterium]|jgi:hypothetical protein|nr:hypothetical protein [Candidatus Binatia bacterium]